MIILTIRTDKPEAEIGLYNDRERLAYEVWEAHRQLGQTIHQKIIDLLKGQNKDWPDIEGLVIFKGPGSFTGLRIGMSVANALASSLTVPIVATGGEWIEKGIKRLLSGESEAITLPEYGSSAYVTLPKK